MTTEKDTGPPAPSHGHHEVQISMEHPLKHPISSNEFHHLTWRRGVSHVDMAMHTKYVDMLMKFDNISYWWDIAAIVVNWHLLAGFVMFPGDIHRTVFVYGHDTLVPTYTLVHQSRASLQAETPGAYSVFSL
jgi:hypothetical protein